MSDPNAPLNGDEFDAALEVTFKFTDFHTGATNSHDHMVNVRYQEPQGRQQAIGKLIATCPPSAIKSPQQFRRAADALMLRLYPQIMGMGDHPLIKEIQTKAFAEERMAEYLDRILADEGRVKTITETLGHEPQFDTAEVVEGYMKDMTTPDCLRTAQRLWALYKMQYGLD